MDDKTFYLGETELLGDVTVTAKVLKVIPDDDEDGPAGYSNGVRFLISYQPTTVCCPPIIIQVDLLPDFGCNYDNPQIFAQILECEYQLVGEALEDEVFDLSMLIGDAVMYASGAMRSIVSDCQGMIGDVMTDVQRIEGHTFSDGLTIKPFKEVHENDSIPIMPVAYHY